MPSIGIDLGGTNIAAGAVDEKGRILSQASTKTKAGRPFSDIVRDMARTVAQVRDRAGVSEVSSIGIGIPGVVDEKTGMVFNCTNLGWINLPLRQEMQKYFDVPIFIDNDANVAALAESCFGVSAGYQSSIMLTLGTGVGGGVIIHGRPWTGDHSRAGEIGHMVLVPDGVPCTCGKSGCVERYCSATALIRSAKQECCNYPHSAILKKANGSIENITANMVIDAAREGDAPALRVFHSFARYLALAINNLIWFFDPGIVVLGGGISYAGDFLLDAVRELIPRHQIGKELPIPPIELARLGNEAGIIGAAMLGD